MRKKVNKACHLLTKHYSFFLKLQKSKPFYPNAACNHLHNLQVSLQTDKCGKCTTYVQFQNSDTKQKWKRSNKKKAILLNCYQTELDLSFTSCPLVAQISICRKIALSQKPFDVEEASQSSSRWVKYKSVLQPGWEEPGPNRKQEMENMKHWCLLLKCNQFNFVTCKKKSISTWNVGIQLFF